jgi:hypothetical protein
MTTTTTTRTDGRSQGFQRLIAACRAGGHPLVLAPPALVVPPGLDPDLAAAYAIADGGELWRLQLVPSGQLDGYNAEERRASPDLLLLRDLTIFAKFDLQAYYLAVGPSQVVLVDLHEQATVRPFAPSVDGCFDRIASHVERSPSELWSLWHDLS